MSRKRPKKISRAVAHPVSHVRSRVIAVAGTIAFCVAGWLLWPHWSAYRHWQLAEQASNKRDFATAASHLRAYAAIYPKSAFAQFQLARTLRREGKYKQAEELLNNSEWIPEVVELEQMLLEVQQHGTRGELREILAGLVAAHHPDELLILEAMVLGDRHTMDFEQAAAWLNVWVDHFPDDPTARLWRAELLMSFKHLEQSRADYLKLLELQPRSSEPLLRLGALSLADRSDYATAEDYYRRVLDREPDNPEAWLGIARCRHGVGDLEGAASAIKKVLIAQPENGEACMLMATIAIDGNDFEDSLLWLKKAKGANVDEQKLHYQFALVLNRLGRTEEAAQQEKKFQHIKRINEELEVAMNRLLKEPKEPKNHHALGLLYLELGKDDAAERWFLGALHQDRGFKPSHKALAEIYSRKGDAQHKSLSELHRRESE